MNVPGHNRPNYLQTVRDQMDEALEPFKARRDEYVAKAPGYQVRDRNEAGKVVDLLGMARDIQAQIEVARKEISNPHHDARSLAINIAEAFWRPVLDALETPEAHLQAYEARRDQLLAEQQSELAQIRNPPAHTPRAAVDYTSPVEPSLPLPNPDAPRPARKAAITGDYGYTRTEKVKPELVVVDVLQVPDHILNSDPVKEAIAKVALAIVKATKQTEMPGCRISLNTSASIRS